MEPKVSEVKACRQLLEDLRAPRATTYFVDAGLSAGLGWLLFAAALAGGFPAGIRLAAFLGSALLLYRALAFIHELVHQQGLRRFRIFWHLVAGIPLLLPLLLYLPVHQGHHNARTYGTAADGEYEDFSGRAWMMACRLFALNVLLPVALLVRFAILTPLGFVIPVVRREVIPSFVHLSLRIPHRAPELTGRAAEEAMKVELACALFAWALIAVAWSGHAMIMLLWALLAVTVATLNTVRALCSTHLYVEHPGGRDTLGQVADSLNIDAGGWRTEALCPVGLRYHALHHLAPYLPYHAMPAAHARLMAALPADSAYRAATVSGLLDGLRRLRAATSAAGRPHTRGVGGG